MSKQEELVRFKDILKNIFVVAFSKFQNETFNTSFDEVKKRLKEEDIQNIYKKKVMKKINEDFSDFSSVDWGLDLGKCPQIFDLIMMVFAEANRLTSRSSSGLDSPFKNDQFCKDLIALSCSFLFWTKIMSVPKSTVLSMDLLDRYKQDIKLYISPDESVLTVDKFIIKNIDFGFEKLKYFKFSNTKNLPSKDQGISRKKYLQASYMFEEENWKNKNPPEHDLDRELSAESDFESIAMDEDVDDNIIDPNQFQTNFNGISMEINDETRDLNDLKTIKRNCYEYKLNENESSKSDFTMEDISDNNKISAIEKSQNKEPEKDNTEKNTVKNQLIKKRGSYLSPCPDFDALHQRPAKGPPKKTLLVNCNQQKARKEKKEKIYINSSSYFDSILDLLAKIYFIMRKFKAFVDSTMLRDDKTDFIYILQKYVSELKPTSIYKDRAILIKQIYDKLSSSKNNDQDESFNIDKTLDNADYKIVWSYTVGDFFRKTDLPCIIIKYNCLKCKNISYQYASAVEMSLSTFVHSEDINQTILSNLTSSLCHNCKLPVNAKFEVVSHLLCLDIEKRETGSEGCRCDINSLNTNLSVLQKNFRLVGVIGFEEPIGNNVERHYVSYFKNMTSNNLTNYWQKIDDSEHKKKPVGITSKNISVNISMIFYAEL